jgi:hypothetical protein
LILPFNKSQPFATAEAPMWPRWTTPQFCMWMRMTQLVISCSKDGGGDIVKLFQKMGIWSQLTLKIGAVKLIEDVSLFRITLIMKPNRMELVDNSARDLYVSWYKSQWIICKCPNNSAIFRWVNSCTSATYIYIIIYIYYTYIH